MEKNKLIFLYVCVKPFSLTKNEGKLFLVPKSSGPLLAGLPLKPFSTDYGLGNIDYKLALPDPRTET